MIDHLLFLAQRRRGFTIPHRPWFDTEETTGWFLQRLGEAKRYLEFGAGGSTFTAAELGVEFVTVESDWRFLAAAKAEIEGAGNLRPREQFFRYIDIGATGRWGYPVGAVTPQRRDGFRKYSTPPAECFHSGGWPDLVLVDGRFRVACALKTLLALRDQSGWLIVVDDYADRPQYRVIADFAVLDRYVGRMAVFNAARDIDPELLDSAIDAYELIPA